MEWNVLCADPSGNRTLFVLDPAAPEDRADIAAALMARLPEQRIEQVGFCCPPERGGAGRLEMAGGEFCGNAARAFGCLLAVRSGQRGPARLSVEVSGCPDLVEVEADPARGWARAAMPLPRSVRRVETDALRGTLVHLGGIAHLVLPDTAPEERLLPLAEPLFRAEAGLEAFGLIFQAGERLTPLVKVLSAGTLFWEGSCGSGTIAAAIAQSEGLTNGRFQRAYQQPAGAVGAVVERRGGRVRACAIEGTVSLSEPFRVTLSPSA